VLYTRVTRQSVVASTRFVIMPLATTKKIHYYVNQAPTSLRKRIPRFLAEINGRVAQSLRKCRYSASDI
jgi:hypothetical protein